MPAPSAAPVALTEKLLITAGGWDAIRHARGLREAGRVSGAHWSPPVLQGMVREGDREYRAGLKILSQTNVENLCTCRPSREYGTICAHSLAVGLAIIAGQSPPPAPAATRPGTPPPPTVAVALPYHADPNAPARMHVVLAPDVAAAWSKGQLLVGLELATGNNRGMFGAGGGRTLRPEDFRVVERLAAITKAVPGGMSFVDRAGFLALLDTLAAHPRVTLGRDKPLTVDAAALRPPLAARFLDDDSLEIRVGLPDNSRVLTAGGHAWLLNTEKAGPTTLQPLSPGLPAPYLPLLEERSRRLPRDHAAAFLDTEWPRLEPFFDLRSPSISPASTVVAEPEPEPPQFALSLEGSLNGLSAELRAVYPDNRIQHASAEPERRSVAFNKNAPTRLVRTRNVTSERAAVARVNAWGFAGPNAANQYFLSGEDAVLRFFVNVLPALKQEPNWQVTVGARFTNVAKQIEIITPEFSVARSGEDWFEMELGLTGSSGERYSASEVQRLLQMGAGRARLPNGKRAILPEAMLNDFQEVLRDCDPSQPRPGVYRLDQSRGAYLESTLERWNVAAAPSWQQYVERRGGFQRASEINLPAGLADTMRPYQQEGVRWLHLLAANSLGGILADEMGLGKTLQALAYLASSIVGRAPRLPRDDAPNPRSGPSAGGNHHAAGGAPALQPERQPSLVVCPTSLVDNWRQESAKFTPGLRTLAIDGPDRAPLFAKIDTADLVITSYALLRRDLDKYRTRQFAAVILDEAHHIKNPDSQVAQAACALRSQRRFVLTGTPMENSVRDLWSIMHFALPGYLGSRQDFRERYEQPLSRPGDPAAEAVRERLTRRLRPVLLRRRKKDVATELPDRIEQTAFCDLTPAQREVYRGLLEQSRLKLDTARRDKNQGAGRMLVLTALLRLRQACCDLRLLGLPENAAAPDAESVPPSSAKLALLDELLEEIREGGHRVLIFSQFVSMLKILSAHLEAAKTPFCYLDGSTKPRDRTAQVERFQTDESMTAFLISVKAGGVGLNLTGADTVIHFDPWWNPAVEAQATDRAHRIGQTRVVTAYRLIARNTVEEKIFALQNRKKELTASLVEREKDEPLLETLSFAEIEGLLE